MAILLSYPLPLTPVEGALPEGNWFVSEITTQDATCKVVEEFIRNMAKKPSIHIQSEKGWCDQDDDDLVLTIEYFKEL